MCCANTRYTSLVQCYVEIHKLELQHNVVLGWGDIPSVESWTRFTMRLEADLTSYQVNADVALILSQVHGRLPSL